MSRDCGKVTGTMWRKFADIERRLDDLCVLAPSGCEDAGMLAELGDVLAHGYVSALQADARCRRLAERIERLVDDRDRADEVRRLAQERQTIRVATRRLRARLEIVRARFARVSAQYAG